MELAQEKIDIIEKVIKSNRKFASNEDLYDDFFNETCKRSLAIIKTVTSDAALEAYLRKIATTSIINVLKNEGRLRRSKDGYIPVDQISLDEPDTVDYSNAKISYTLINIQETPEDNAVKKDILQKIMDVVCEIDRQAPLKDYLKLYNLRYNEGLTQSEISDRLDLSQSEVSKRLFRLMSEVKQALV